MERSLQSRKKEGAVLPGRSASFDYRVGFGVSVLNRCKAIHQERLKAEETARFDARNDPNFSSSLVVRKRELVDEHCTSDIQGSRKRTVRFRRGTAHSAGAADGSDVSLDNQISNQQNTAIADAD